MSTHSHDDTFPETDRSGDRTLGEKVRDAAQETGGKIKEGWGDLTDNERLEAEGRQQAREADVRQARDHTDVDRTAPSEQVYDPFTRPDEPIV